jgi:hypothetical protein
MCAATEHRATALISARRKKRLQKKQKGPLKPSARIINEEITAVLTPMPAIAAHENRYVTVSAETLEFALLAVLACEITLLPVSSERATGNWAKFSALQRTCSCACCCCHYCAAIKSRDGGYIGAA